VDGAREAVVATVTELVDAGLESWRARMDRLLELHAVEGGRRLFIADGVTCLA
jgi:hypothetical protein